MFSSFSNPQSSHEHSLITLNELYEYDDFMESISRVVDLGCGAEALDLQWWADATSRDDEDPQPLNIQCTGIDIIETINASAKRNNISYQRTDLETWDQTKRPYDVLWCHDTFQYITNPLQALGKWWNVAAQDAMLVLVLPQTTNIEFNQQAYDLPSGCYYNHTLSSLMYMLAVNGWDCGGGFFKKKPNENWLHAIVYRSEQTPRDPRSTTWYDLLETGLLPKTAEESIVKYGKLRQRDLVLPWVDKSLTWFGQQ